MRPAERLHRVLVDVVGDCLAYAVADLDRTHIVHSTPDPEQHRSTAGGITGQLLPVRTRSREARIERHLS